MVQFLNRLLNHWIRSKRGFIQELSTAVLLTDAQLLSGGFKGNIFSAKLSKTDSIVFKI